MRTVIFYVLILLLLTSCRAIHNVPTAASPNIHIAPNISIAYVDLNGNFYPDQWAQKIGPYERKSSLYLTAKRNGKLQELTAFEANKLTDIKIVTSNKKRIFIFVHGYNNDASLSKINYDNIRKKIRIDPVNDEVIEFYWDGLVAHNPGSSAKIWFNAAGYSQMAGEFGLRSILNQIYGKDIILISHSRGASVVLSALSNPPYNPKFYATTNNLGIPIGNKTPLAENNNRIISIMLAPAIGEIDFTREDNNTYRPFSEQLKKIHITINETDPVLNKFIGLPGSFNATTLGHDLKAYNNLQPQYGFFTCDDFTGQKEHDFVKYLDNPKFLEMVKKYIP
jgi:hypothetical protein